MNPANPLEIRQFSKIRCINSSTQRVRRFFNVFFFRWFAPFAGKHLALRVGAVQFKDVCAPPGEKCCTRVRNFGWRTEPLCCPQPAKRFSASDNHVNNRVVQVLEYLKKHHEFDKTSASQEDRYDSSIFFAYKNSSLFPRSTRKKDDCTSQQWDKRN